MFVEIGDGSDDDYRYWPYRASSSADRNSIFENNRFNFKCFIKSVTKSFRVT